MVSRAAHNEKLDTWALGVLAFELLFGYAPFTPKDIKERGLKMKAMEQNILVDFVYGREVTTRFLRIHLPCLLI
jgi:serine/threonine protein kinase